MVKSEKVKSQMQKDFLPVLVKGAVIHPLKAVR